jgi:hypothetical protein
MTRGTTVAALFIAVLPFAFARAVAQGNPSTATVPSFDVWCLELQLLPAARCDSRNNVDTQTYEHYRTLAEKFAQQKADHERHDQEIIDLLNRDPFDIKH